MSDADPFEYQALCQQLEFFRGQVTEAEKELREFAKKATQVEHEAREVLATVPQVGEVTIDVVLSEVGEARRFRSAKRIVAYAGLDPGYRKSAGKSRRLAALRLTLNAWDRQRATANSCGPQITYGD